MAGFSKISKSQADKFGTKSGPELFEDAIKLHKAGEIAKAEKLYLKSIDSGFHNELAFLNLGFIYRNAGRHDEELAIYERAISIDLHSAEVYANLGNFFKNHGNLDQALASTL